MFNNMLKIFAMLSTIAFVTACNTVRGVGEDLKSAADAVDQET